MANDINIRNKRASFDYELIGYKESNLVKMDILLNGDIVDALSLIVHKDFAYNRGKKIVENLTILLNFIDKKNILVYYIINFNISQ